MWSFSLAPHAQELLRDQPFELSLHLRGDVLVASNTVAGEVAVFRPSSDGAPLLPHTKTLDLTIDDVSDPAKIEMRIGERDVHVPPSGHWRGAVSGRGKIAVVAAEGFPDSLTGGVVDMEDGEPHKNLELHAFTMDQACKP